MDEVIAFEEGSLPEPAEVLAGLERMLTSEALRLSDRNRRFLAFVVRQAIDGHADRIKAYTIGVDVFGRDDSFDPTIDPIVRIEATRLRSALANYYESCGRTDAITISIPKGSYVPAFSRRHSFDVARARANPRERGVETVVIQDLSRCTDAETELRRDVFTDALVIALRKAGIRVRLMPGDGRSAVRDAIAALYADPGNACSLDVAVRLLGERRRFSSRLVELRSGEVLCSESREFPTRPTPCYDVIDAFAGTVASSVADVLANRPLPSP